MKTKVEINGYEITVEENEGLITVKAEKEGEIVEEFSLESSEGEEGSEGDEAQGEDIKSFGDFGGEEEDFGGEDFEEEMGEEAQDEDEDDEDEDDEDEDEGKALESFQSFINKRKK